MGANDTDIIMDVVMISNSNLGNWQYGKVYHPLGVYSRWDAIHEWIQSSRQLVESMEYHPKINYRYVIRPSKPLPSSSFPFLFNHNQLIDMVKQGNDDAKAAIKFGAGKSARKALKEAYDVMFNEGIASKAKNYETFAETYVEM
jgi:hypothetical protein